MDPDLRRRVEANLFPVAMPAVEPWDEFPWHKDAYGRCDTWKPHSSQALCIDVFGTLKVVDQLERDRTCDRLCEKLGATPGGPWAISLEWSDPDNLMCERRHQTQVDAVARGRHSLIFFELKFTEAGAGCCSQPQPLRSGDHKGQVQCNGNYEMQTNPVNAIVSSCALTGKGIQYWKVIPNVFNLSATNVYAPCPFAGSGFQWMRNLTVCQLVAAKQRLQPCCVIVYVDKPTLAMPAYFESQGWVDFAQTCANRAPLPMPLAQFLELASSTERSFGGGAGSWGTLAKWITKKVAGVGAL
jgi:restriction endonuclease-like protein